MRKPKNPFNTYGQGFDAKASSPQDVFNASAVAGLKDQERRQEQSNVFPQAVSLPPHLFIPETAQSLDLRQAASISTGTTATLIRFVAPQNMKTVFLSYAVYNDALLFNNCQFFPTVNGNRIYPFHGDPQNNYKIALGLAPDLSNNSLIPGLLYMSPGQVLEWKFTNNEGVDVVAGVRMSGYVDQNIINKTGRFGG